MSCRISLFSLLLLGLLLLAAPAIRATPEPHTLQRDGVVTLTLAEHAQLKWDTQMVTYPMTFPKDTATKASILLTDDTGTVLPYQLSAITYWDRTKIFLKSAQISFLSSLDPLQQRTFCVFYSANRNLKTPNFTTDLQLSRYSPTSMILQNSKMAVRIATGERTYKDPMLSVDVPSPIQAVKGPDGIWRGRGYLDTYWRVTGYKSQVVASGPIFTEMRVTYHFEHQKSYTVTLRLTSKMDWLQVSESMNLGQRNKFVFDCSANFSPDKLGLLTPRNDMLVRDLHYFDDILQARFSVFTQYTQLFDFREGLGVFESGNAKDFIGAFVYNPGEWTRAKVNFAEFWEHRQAGDDYLTRDVLTTNGKADAFPAPERERIPAQGTSSYSGHFTWEFQLYDGHREWCLTVGDKAQQRPSDPRVPAHLRSQVSQVTACSLDHMKNMTLAWPAPPLPPAPSVPDESKRVEVKKLIDTLRNFVERFYYQESWSAINAVAIRSVAPSTERYLALRNAGAITPDEDQLIRAYYAFLAYIEHDPAAYPWNKSMLPYNDPESTEPLFAGMVNQNFNTDRYNLVGAVGLTFPEHPDSKVWRDHFLQQLDAQLDFYLYPASGCWEESHTYANHIQTTILPTLHRFRTDFNCNLFGDERLKKMFDFFVRTVSPVDPNFGTRITPAVGDHEEGTQYRDIYRNAAQEFNTVDPAFARRLMWMYRAQGGTEPSSIPEEAPVLTSEYLPGFGATMRATDRSGDETYLLLRNGQSWGHSHADDNSIQLWAKGAHLVVDAARGSRGDDDVKVGAWGHSHVIPHDMDLTNFLGKQHRGWVKRSYFSDLVDYVCGYTPYISTKDPGLWQNSTPFHPGYHDRQIVFIRPDYFLVRDTVRTDLFNEDFFLHLDSTSVTQNGETFTTQTAAGVDLDIQFLQPEKMKAEIGTATQNYVVFTRGKTGGYTRESKSVTTGYIKSTQKPNTDFLYLLYPRKHMESGVTITPLVVPTTKQVVGAKVTRGNGVDYIFLAHDPVSYTNGDISFTGSVGVIILTGDTVSLSLPDGEMIRYKDQVKTK